MNEKRPKKDYCLLFTQQQKIFNNFIYYIEFKNVCKNVNVFDKRNI